MLNLTLFLVKMQFYLSLLCIIFIGMDKDEICKEYVMKRILNMVNLDDMFGEESKLNFDEDKSIEFAKYLLLVDYGVENTSGLTDLAVNEVKNIKNK